MNILKNNRPTSSNSKITIKEYKINERITESENNIFTEIIKMDIVYLIGDEFYNKSFLIKYPFTTFVYSSLSAVGTYNKEVYVYESILSEMNRILDHEISPHVYIVANREILILQDLSYFGFQTKNNRKQLTLQESKIALKTLAKFHAASYKLNLQNTNLFNKEFKGISNILNIVVEIIEIWLPIISAVLEKENFLPQQIQKLSSFSEKFVEKFTAIFEGFDTEFSVLNHGDFRTTNILLKYNDQGDPIEAKLIDYQLCHWTSPAYDIIYFFVSSLPFDIFEKHSEDLYDTYLKTLNKTLIKLNCQYQYQKTELKNSIDKMKLFYLPCFLLLGILIGDLNCFNFNLSCMKGNSKKNDISLTDMIDKIHNDELFRTSLHKWFQYFVTNEII
ncbi:hypothetical protein PGB90_007294 [Kerria lacca]